MAKNELTLRLSPEIEARLRKMAENSGNSVDELLVQAVEEFLETWEDFQRTQEALENGVDERVMLQAVND